MVLERLAKFGRRRGYMLMRCPSCMFDAKRNQLHNTCPFPELSRAISQAPCATAAACTKHPVDQSLGSNVKRPCFEPSGRGLSCMLCTVCCAPVAVSRSLSRLLVTNNTSQSEAQLCNSASTEGGGTRTGQD